MLPRTLFLSRLIGLYCILVALSMITHKQATLESVTAVLHDSSMMFVLGAITLAAGLAMVLAHNIWFLRQFHYQELFYMYGTISLVLGVYLTYGGFKSRSN